MDSKTSKLQNMPGCGPQGTLLGLLIFIVNFNRAGTKSTIDTLGANMTKPLKKEFLLKKRNVHLLMT